MKIIYKAFRNYLNDIYGLLLYGPDIDKIQRIECSIKDFFVIEEKLSYRRFPYSLINTDVGILKNELYSHSLTGRKLIVVYDITAILIQAVRSILDNYSSDNFLLFIASELNVQSTIRKYFEQSKKFAAIPCYSDETEKILRELLHGFIYSNEVLQFLKENFATNTLLLRSEIAKLLTFMDNDKIITMEHVLSCQLGHNEYVLNDLCISFADHDVLSVLHYTTQSDISVILFIRVLVTYFLRLERVLYLMSIGISITEAIDSLKPPVFFKHKTGFKRHLNIWTKGRIKFLLHELLELEILCKSNTVTAQEVFEQFLIENSTRIFEAK